MSDSTNKLLKIAITGPESTGKSTLAMQLAEHYQTVYVPEYARLYLNRLQKPYTEEDVWKITEGQLKSVEKAIKSAKKLIFCDTELTVIKIWLENAYNYCPEWILNFYREQSYDLYLLMNIDHPWEPDPLREHPNQRMFFYEWHQKELSEMKRNFVEISGWGQERLANAIQVIDRFLFAF